MTGASAVFVEALGVRVRIDVAPSLAADMERIWAACLTSDEPADALLEAVVDMDELRARERPQSDAELLERVTQEVTLAAIKARAGELLMLHACAVADPVTGAVVVCVGPSGMGKTTLASTLGRRWPYVTDETVAVDAAGVVSPYPKPLSVRRPGCWVKEQVPPEDLGLTPAKGPLHAAAVLLLDRRDGVEEVSVEDVATIPAVALLAEHTSYLASFEKPLSRVARFVHQAGGLRRVTYSEAESLIPVVGSLLAGAP